MDIRPVTADDTQQVATLAHLLWPDTDRTELIEAARASFKNSDEQTFVAINDSEIIGFVMVGLRHDYVEGSASSPVGYIEGIFVLPDYRKNGVGRLLIDAAEAWCGDQGCTEMGSDTEVENVSSQQFHMQCGYSVANHIVHFIKPLQKK